MPRRHRRRHKSSDIGPKLRSLLVLCPIAPWQRRTPRHLSRTDLAFPCHSLQ
uniref:Uncharacterized protein n=1 Tax=Rhizophora mucronata TaxID=61149 RepID=A0A2P2R1L6_RHIMU